MSLVNLKIEMYHHTVMTHLQETVGRLKLYLKVEDTRIMKKCVVTNPQPIMQYGISKWQLLCREEMRFREIADIMLL